eukprot:TRINITY_DN30_c0_g1_i2.p1 TRINITY_DN30_c0_g1~~TRINITY_DN30_c0_g1_i2.p1  ORF type:complete len:344 (-),score=58.48 TRINITY_DN30_c0_g1_i2:49-1011(-)
MTYLSEDDVCSWLSSTVGLPQYTKVFKDNDVDGSVLLSLTDSDLKDLGITSLGHRKKIMESIKLFTHTGGHGLTQPTQHPSHVPLKEPPSHGNTSQPKPVAVASHSHNLQSAPHNQPDSNSVPLFKLTLEGIGLIGGLIGETTQFHIKCVDPNSSSPKDIEGSKLGINIDGPSTVTAKLTGGGSSYTVSYSVNFPGEYFIDILYDQKSVLNEPVRVFFHAPAEPSSCIAEYPSTSPVDSVLTIKILARDSDGNPVKGGGEPFKINVSGPDSRSLSDLAVENDGDIYYLTCKLHSAGAEYTFHILLNDQHIGNSPFTVYCS